MADPQIAQWFHTVDKNRTGRLGPVELQNALRNNNYTTFNIQVVQMMIKMFDRDNTQTINVNEFCELWKYLGQWRQTFDRYDTDRSGNISQQELSAALQQMGYSGFSPQFIQTLYKKYDFDKSGSLQFDGFVHAIIVIQRLTGAFQQYDLQRNGHAQFTYEQYLTSVVNTMWACEHSPIDLNQLYTVVENTYFDSN